MSDGLPTEEQLRRIARGVRGRIDRRRRVVRGLAGTTAGVLLLAGGIALLPRLGVTAMSGGASGSGSGSRAAASSARVEVRCRLGDRVHRTVAPDEPGRIAQACGATAVDFQSAGGRMPSPSPSAVPRAVLCRGGDGVVDVLPAGDRPGTACVRAGLRPY